MKNTNAIDKIIAELAMKDYLQANPKKADGRPKYKKYHPYSLSDEIDKTEYPDFITWWDDMRKSGVIEEA